MSDFVQEVFQRFALNAPHGLDISDEITWELDDKDKLQFFVAEYAVDPEEDDTMQPLTEQTLHCLDEAITVMKTEGVYWGIGKYYHSVLTKS